MQTRQSNIELCRIFAILLVVLVHSNFAWTGTPHNISGERFYRFLVQAFAIIGVNVFVLITGYFSTTLKTKSIFNLFYICFFYAIVRLGWGLLSNNFVIKDIFFISNSNWFIVTYIGLLLLSPILNKVAEANITLFKYILVIGGGYELYFSFFPALSAVEPGFNHGYSILSFAILYLIGRYIRLFDVPKWIRKLSFFLYIICSSFLGFLAFFVFNYTSKNGLNPQLFTRLYDYNNPIVVFSAICFFLTFEKLKIGNKKWINHIAKSTLAVLLIHGSAAINPPMKKYFNDILSDYSDVALIGMWALGILVIFVLSVVIDQFRLLSYRLVGAKIENKAEAIATKIKIRIQKG